MACHSSPSSLGGSSTFFKAHNSTRKQFKTTGSGLEKAAAAVVVVAVETAVVEERRSNQGENSVEKRCRRWQVTSSEVQD